MAMSIRSELSKQDQEREEERFRREQAREEAWMERFARLEAKLVSASLSQHPSTSRPEPVPEKMPVKKPTPDQSPDQEPSPQEAEIVISAQESDLDSSDSSSSDSEDQTVDACPPTSSSQSQSGSLSLASQATGTEFEELSYRETMSALRHTLGMTIPDKEGPVLPKKMPWLDTGRPQPSGKLALHLPADEHLCDLMAGLQVSVAEGNVTRTTEPSALSRGQFLKGPLKHRWYSMYQDHKAIKDHPSEVKWWTQEAQRLNATFPRICRPAASSAPGSLSVSQDSLRRWERIHRDQTIMINQAAGMIRGQGVIKNKLDVLMNKLTRDLNKHFTLPDEVTHRLRDIQAAVEFSHRLTSSVSNVIRDITDGTLANLANTVLMRRDSYLEGLKPGVSLETLGKLRAGPFHSETLFEEDTLARAEEELRQAESKPRQALERKDRSASRYQPYPNKPKDDSGSNRSDWRRFAKKKSHSAPKVKSQVSKPAKGQQTRK